MNGKAPRGRPRKNNPTQPGQLKPGLMYFNVIADKEKIKELRVLSKKIDISIKNLMDEALNYILYKRRDDPEKEKLGIGKRNEAKPKRNEVKLKEYLSGHTGK